MHNYIIQISNYEQLLVCYSSACAQVSVALEMGFFGTAAHVPIDNIEISAVFIISDHSLLGMPVEWDFLLLQ